MTKVPDALDHLVPRPDRPRSGGLYPQRTFRWEWWVLAGWIFTVDGDFPQHVKYATKHGFWDTKANRGISPGETSSSG
jgi:hypothetical protein